MDIKLFRYLEVPREPAIQYLPHPAGETCLAFSARLIVPTEDGPPPASFSLLPEQSAAPEPTWFIDLKGASYHIRSLMPNLNTHCVLLACYGIESPEVLIVDQDGESTLISKFSPASSAWPVEVMPFWFIDSVAPPGRARTIYPSLFERKTLCILLSIPPSIRLKIKISDLTTEGKSKLIALSHETLGEFGYFA